MKISKLLNKISLAGIFLILLSSTFSYSEEQPVDIWNIEKKEIEKKILNDDTNISSTNNESQTSTELSIFSMQSSNDNDLILQDKKIESKDVKIIGLYDPEDYGLNIDMWLNSNGDQLKNIFSNLSKIDFSDDAVEIMNISMLTNAYIPQRNISEKEFLKFKSDWLIKNNNLELIEEYLIKNQIINIHPELTKYLVNQYLSQANIKKSCDLFSKNIEPIKDEYLSKFSIYCSIVLGKKDVAQLNLDLKKELGFKDDYFENKINFLLGYIDKVDKKISEKTILDFHLAHMTNTEFFFEPKDSTDKIIWKYLSSSNLLYNIQEIEITELDRISTIEKAVHNENYPEKDLFELYKRFQFNINQLLNAETSYKALSSIEARALIYQKILLESEIVEKLKLLKILKNLFKKDNINQAFNLELKKFLKKIDPLDVPDNLTSFYYTNVQIENNSERNIKFNNDIIHQSKLINYFNGDYAKSKIEKDINNFLKKIKKNKKYFLSKKDIIFLESLKSDGIEISKKFDDLYEINESEIPTDIQVMINNNEAGTALLRIVEVIGQDDLEKIDEDTIYFIISTLNQLDIDFIRNKILLKVLPLKV
ncbi:hypothetical protein OA412_01495 [Candidatus Pelagibacter sp.]|nr:hypothetical protein [Candidatus Pelagibacter sp.]